MPQNIEHEFNVSYNILNLGSKYCCNIMKHTYTHTFFVENEPFWIATSALLKKFRFHPKIMLLMGFNPIWYISTQKDRNITP
jgi:hypothetical protein